MAGLLAQKQSRKAIEKAKSELVFKINELIEGENSKARAGDQKKGSVASGKFGGHANRVSN